MATISEERQRNAALFGAFHLAAQRTQDRPPPALPTGLRPYGFAQTAAYFRTADLHDEWVKRAYRSALWALHRAECRAEVATLLAAWRNQQKAKRDRGYNGHAKRNGQGKQNGRAQENGHGKRNAYGNEQAVRHCLHEGNCRPLPTQKQEPPDIHFDPKDWITTVTVKFSSPVRDRAEAVRLVKFAFPSNWSKASDSFFKIAELGHYDRSEFTPFGSDEELCRDWKEPVFLHEHVRWAWNGDSEFETDNHFMVKVLKFADLNKKGGNGAETLLDYTYSLASSNWSKSLIVWDQGGLDVDQGRYTATLTGKTLDVTATKSVRFVAPRNGPYEIALALNLMAGTTVSMLLSRLNDFATLHDHRSDHPKETLPWPSRRTQRRPGRTTRQPTSRA